MNILQMLMENNIFWGNLLQVGGLGWWFGIPADSSTTSNHRPKPTIFPVTSVAESFDSAKKKKQHKVKTQNSTNKNGNGSGFFKISSTTKGSIDLSCFAPKVTTKKKQQPTIFGEEIPGDFRGFILPPQKNRSEALSRKKC